MNERQGDPSQDKKIYKLILQSNRDEGLKLRHYLQGQHQRANKLDVTGIRNHTGFTPLSFALYKERPVAVEILVSYVEMLEGGQVVKVQTTTTGGSAVMAGSEVLSVVPPQDAVGQSRTKSLENEQQLFALTLAEWINTPNRK